MDWSLATTEQWRERESVARQLLDHDYNQRIKNSDTVCDLTVIWITHELRRIKLSIISEKDWLAR